MSIKTGELVKECPQYFDELYNFALRMTCSEKKAARLMKDIAREIKKFNNIYNPPDIPIWLFRNAINLYVKLYASGESPFEELPDPVQLSGKYDKIMISSILKSVEEKDIPVLLLNIPSELRMSLVLKDVLKLNYSVISDLLDIPEDTLIFRIALARKYFYSNLIKLYEKDA